MATEKTYVLSEDRIVSPVLVLHFDSATGAEVGAAGEGRESYSVAIRSNAGGAPRLSIGSCYVSKGRAPSAADKRDPQKWCVVSGRPVLGVPVEGALVVSKWNGRCGALVAPHLMAKVAAFAAKAAAALEKRAA